ncbi:MAG: hypothetical protein JNM68_05540 [Dinghuibacter sp.]|nr:hypothetical protein [Dinghuibacter sp.]
MKKMSVLFVLLTSLFFTAAASNNVTTGSENSAEKKSISKANTHEATQLVTEKFNAPVEAKGKKKPFDSSCGVIFYCNGGFVHLNVTIIGDALPGECQAVRDAIERFIRDNYCNEV